ncbi:MAG: DNA topoisomerase VI subunit B [Candidatus Nanoarchaeia archaeon]
MSEGIAHKMAAKQREIGIAEFFSRNRHLLGFDNKRKALMTTIKEAVDNSLDACEEAHVLPEIIVEVINMGEDRLRVIIEDNGPGIVKKQIPKIFAKLLYGSKFHSFKMSRGQQGIGISASVMYGQLTTGKAARITSKIKGGKGHYYELKLNTKKNAPDIMNEDIVEWDKKHGTRIEIDLEATYQKGSQSVDEYLKQTAIANPHITIIYTNPKAEQIIFPRATEEVPPHPKAIKPHPYGVELGILVDMIQATEGKTLQSFLTNEFSRVSSNAAKEICENAKLLPKTKPKSMSREQVELLMKGIKATKIMNPPTDCVTPIGAEALKKGLKKEVNAEFYTSITRTPSVYRGNPFIIEVGIAYGGLQKGDSSANLLRFANRVPLLYQQGAGAINKAIIETNWRSYGLQQSTGSVPIGPVTIMVHIASVWVPFTSEGKEAVANYPEIIKEMKLAIQECGRSLASYVRKKQRISKEGKTRKYIEIFIPHMTDVLADLLGLTGSSKTTITNNLKDILEEKRGKMQAEEFDPTKNVEYDETFANIGKEETDEEKEEE